MTIQRMELVGITVNDLEAAIAFFEELGMELEGKALIEGQWAARLVGLDDQRVDVAMMRTPDGHGRIELAKYHEPEAISGVPHDAPANTLGIRRVMFKVDDLEDVIARLRTRGGEPVGEVVQYEDVHRLCYIRGPEGIVVSLYEDIV